MSRERSAAGGHELPHLGMLGLQIDRKVELRSISLVVGPTEATTALRSPARQAGAQIELVGDLQHVLHLLSGRK